MSPEKTVSYSYDEWGMLKTWSDGVYSGSFSRDYLARLDGADISYPESLTTSGFSKSYAYSWQHDVDSPTSYTSPEGDIVVYSYTDDLKITPGMLGGLSFADDWSLDIEDYDFVFAEQFSWKDDNDFEFLHANFGIYENGSLSSLSYSDPTTADVLLGMSFEYDYLGRLEKKVQSGSSTIDYEYNIMGPVESAEVVGGGAEDENFRYSSDWIAQRMEVSSDDVVVLDNFEYGDDWRLDAYVDEGGVDVHWIYDVSGRAIERYEDGVLVLELVWTIDERLEAIKNGNGRVLATYTYDPFGRRMSKSIFDIKGDLDERIHYFYSERGLIGEYDDLGTPLRTFGWFPQYNPGASGGVTTAFGGGVYSPEWGTDPVWLQVHDSSYGPVGTYFYVNDYQGTPYHLVDMAGAPVWSAVYSTFGEPSVSLSTVDNPLRRAGQYYDEESELAGSDSGLHYNWHRYYLPVEGRYLSEDPLGLAAGDLDVYRYTMGSPGNFVDPDGQIIPALVGGGAALWAAAEFAGSAMDAYELSQTLMSDCASTGMKVASAGLFAAGFVLPGSGYLKGGKAAKRSLMPSPCAKCFSEDTTVATADGPTAIGDLEMGDWVWALDDKTGDLDLQPITGLYERRANETITVWIEGQAVVNSPEHPFWVMGEGWREARDLKAGDLLLSLDGSYREVDGTEIGHEITTLVNLTVAESHTFFVGEGGVWVHNACGGASKGVVPARALTAGDLGLDAAKVTKLDGRFAVEGGVATVRVDMIQGELGSSGIGAIKNLSATAKAAGATELRIESTLANERLYNVLNARYGVTSEGATDIITIPLK